MNKRIAWLTDIHLNYLTDAGLTAFVDDVRRERPDAVLISGDIAEAPTVTDYLQRLVDCWRVPVYFVLGNHDFYDSSFSQTRREMRRFVKHHPHLMWLSEAGVVELTRNVGLVGHECWADGRNGCYVTSRAKLGDYRRIHDLTGLDADTRLARLNRLGDDAAAYLERTLPAALERYPRVLMLSHVPPLGEATNSMDKPWASDFLPHFTCKAVGDVILDVMRAYPHRELTVLCGHAHGGGEAQVYPNLRVICGGATYREPEVKQVFLID